MFGGVSHSAVYGGSYAANGPAAFWMNANGLATNKTFDTDGRIAGLATTYGATAMQNLGYSFDANDRLVALANGINPGLNEGLPNASLVEIHEGNTAKDVAGCFAVGTAASKNRVRDSRPAMSTINSIIQGDGGGHITVIVR